MSKIKKLHIFALAAHGKGISGGDRIFIELARRWQKNFPIDIYVWSEGKMMCDKQKLSSGKIKYFVSNISFWCNLGFVFCYVARIVEGIRLGLTLKLKNTSNTYIYNASEFWMDSLPCILLKLRYRKINWIASWYQTAPNPLQGFSEGSLRDNKYSLSAFYYWFMQIPIKPFIARYANKVIVNNEDERKRFLDIEKKGDVIVLIGAVPLSDIDEWTKKNNSIKKKYSAVFQGRFHPQKGVLELIDIWKNVTEKFPGAKLAMIGDGPLMREARERINNLNLKNNITLFGYVFDGPKKYKIFSQSKLVVHPAFYDSGGMASAEAMAFELPCIGFDLKAYESYYPKGMLKVNKGDKKAFADAVVDLLKDETKRNKIGLDAGQMIKSYWSWDKRAYQILKSIEE